jgi:Bacterial SH3 domain
VKGMGNAAILSVVLSCAVFLNAQTDRRATQREFSFPITAVDAALKHLGAYTGARLPTLDGFITTDRAQMPHYQRPYYEYKINLTISGPNRTLVQVKAKVSAWYEDPQGQQSGYQTLESNGRLESDLLDRLGNYLTANQSKLMADPATLAKQIAGVREQETEAQQHIAELEQQLQQARAGADKQQADPAEFVTVNHGRVVVLKAPEEHAPILLHGQAEDEFQVVEHRGPWLRVSLGDGGAGWIRSSEVRPVSATDPKPGQPSGDTAGFLILRKSVTPFSGDWTPLKGKPALYLWARPVGSSFNASPAGRLQFAQAIFRQRFLQAAHSSQRVFQGVVVIFLDEAGGVAAASLDDIGHWVDGTISQSDFFRRCSFDPRSEFFSRTRGSAARTERKR